MSATKRLRQLKGWNQSTLAKAAGLEQSTISKIERGWDGATIRSMKLIAQALEVPLYQLFAEEQDSSELKLIEVFRDLPEDRQQGWLDMAQSVLDRNQTKPE